MTIVRYKIDPPTHNLTDVSLAIYSEADSLISTINMIEIGSTSVYKANVTTLGNIWGLITCNSLNLTDIVRINPNIISEQQNLDYVKNVVSGGGEQIGTQLIMYASDNITEIARFDLFDKSGNLTADMGLVVKQVRV